MKLCETEIGDKVKIVAVGCDENVKAKLRAMDITSGTIAEVIRVAPFGTPIEIKSDNLRLAIGKAEAALIAVEHVK